jgi:hypothetical protein
LEETLEILSVSLPVRRCANHLGATNNPHIKEIALIVLATTQVLIGRIVVGILAAIVLFVVALSGIDVFRKR